MKVIRSFLVASVGLLFMMQILAPVAGAQPVTLQRAIELAVSGSNASALSAADEMRAQQAYMAARNTFIPQLVVGSGAAFTYGFPLSIEGAAPSIFNLNSQSYLLNFAQREFIRAAKSEYQATTGVSRDRRDQLILETALTYLELAKTSDDLEVLHQQEQASLQLQEVVRARVEAGVESAMENTRAQLLTAQTRLRQTVAEGDGDVLRLRLSQLTGLPANSMATSRASIPPFPEVRQDEDLAAQATRSSWALKVASWRADAREERARGEHKQLYPAVDFVAQYGLFSKFNNFDQYFRKFQRNNATLGVAIRFPFLNYAQKAQASSADAESITARKQAEEIKQQVSSETLRLQRAVRQLSAAREVARLQFAMAQASLQAMPAQIDAGKATVRDQGNARVEEQARSAALLDATFQLEKAELQLLRATGQLENWARGQ